MYGAKWWIVHRKVFDFVLKLHRVAYCRIFFCRVLFCFEWISGSVLKLKLVHRYLYRYLYRCIYIVICIVRFRFFMAPGVAHCGMDTSVYFEALVKWVEQGVVSIKILIS